MRINIKSTLPFSCMIICLTLTLENLFTLVYPHVHSSVSAFLDGIKSNNELEILLLLRSDIPTDGCIEWLWITAWRASCVSWLIFWAQKITAKKSRYTIWEEISNSVLYYLVPREVDEKKMDCISLAWWCTMEYLRAIYQLPSCGLAHRKASTSMIWESWREWLKLAPKFGQKYISDLHLQGQLAMLTEKVNERVKVDQWY